MSIEENSKESGETDAEDMKTPTCNLIIDHLAVTLRIDDPDLAKGVRGEFFNIAKDPDFGSQAYIKNKRYKACIYLHMPNKERVLIQIDPFAGADPYFRISWNPSKLGVSDTDFLKTILDTLLPYGYPMLFVYGRVSRIDITYDVFGRSLSDLTLFPNKATKTKIYYGTKGRPETVYLGVSQARCYWRVYDKSVEQFEKKGVKSDQSWTRFERQQRHQGLLSNIASFKNPFLSLHVVDLHMSNPPVMDYVWQLFQDSVRVRGLDNALALLPKNRRAIVREALKANAEPWWNPEEIWKEWAAILESYGLLTHHNGTPISADPAALVGVYNDEAA